MIPDRSLPGYKLLHLLGRGNTSLVYLAHDPEGREVALKVPHEETLSKQDSAEQFGNEVRLTLQFRHPHVVRGFAGTAFGPRAFVALTYYPEGSLDDVLGCLPGRTLPLEAALRVLADLASALRYLHRLGAVHQDVKPQNVFVQGGRAALGDLGNTYFTAQGGRVSGSPYYMAPEVYHGESSSAASDVYSLGVLAYELLGGGRPFQGHTYEELMVAHLTRFAPPLSHLNPQVPRAAARLAELALAKRPHDRPTADALRRALLTALGETPQDEDTLSDDPLDLTPVRQTGRHAAPVPRAALSPDPASTLAEEPQPGGQSGGRWNPFRRRK